MQKKRRKREMNWQTLVSFFPGNWKELARETRANTRLRGFRSVEALMRTLLLHVARGYSLRETVVPARLSRLARVSDGALLKRLRRAEEWFRTLGVALLKAQGIAMPQPHSQFQLRLVDSTVIKEPGKTGSLWRIHYSFCVPELRCDAFTLTPTKGVGTGDSLTQFTLAPGDHLIADRGYCQAKGGEHVVSNGGAILVRLNTAALPLFAAQGRRVPLLRRLQGLRHAGQIGEWPVTVHGETRVIAGRVCVIRKTEEAITRAHKQLRRNASRDGEVLQPETLEYAKYVMVFTTFDPRTFSAEGILQWYRVRWQVELVFRAWQSGLHAATLTTTTKYSTLCYLYGRMLLILLTSALSSPLRVAVWQHQRELSLFKLARHLQANADHWIHCLFQPPPQLTTFLSRLCATAERLARKAIRKRRTSAQRLRDSLGSQVDFFEPSLALAA